MTCANSRATVPRHQSSVPAVRSTRRCGTVRSIGPLRTCLADDAGQTTSARDPCGLFAIVNGAQSGNHQTIVRPRRRILQRSAATAYRWFGGRAEQPPFRLDHNQSTAPLAHHCLSTSVAPPDPACQADTAAAEHSDPSAITVGRRLLFSHCC